MSFLGHLEELRWHLLRIFIVLIVAVIVMFNYISEAIQYVILSPFTPEFPTHKLLCYLNPSFCIHKIEVSLQATEPAEQFTKALLFSISGGIVVMFPYIVWEIWRFIKPGLYDHEMKKLKGVVFIISGLFVTGVLFAYFIICPFSLSFFSSFKLAPEVQNIWRIGEVISFIVNVCMVGGLMFEMPVLAYFLSKIGILYPQLMRRYRRHAVIIVLLIAGILTPSPDILSQILLALPMMLLYEVSIYISASIEKERNRKAALEE